MRIYIVVVKTRSSPANEINDREIFSDVCLTSFTFSVDSFINPPHLPLQPVPFANNR